MGVSLFVQHERDTREKAVPVHIHYQGADFKDATSTFRTITRVGAILRVSGG